MIQRSSTRLQPHPATTTMKLCHLTGLVAISCGLLASCYPYQESNRKKKPRKPKTEQVSQSSAAKEQENAEAAAKAADEAAKKKAEQTAKEESPAITPTANPEASSPATTPSNAASTQPTSPPQPPSKPRNEYVYANKVPGREGFVFSPYNNKVIDVRGYTSGQLVMDPTYPPSEKKYFRVP